jgi:hypothetical protein
MTSINIAALTLAAIAEPIAIPTATIVGVISKSATGHLWWRCIS